MANRTEGGPTNIFSRKSRNHHLYKGCQNRRALPEDCVTKSETRLGCYERIRKQNLHASLHEQKEEQISIDSFSHEENQLQRQEYS